LEIFQKVPLTLLLGTFSFQQNGENTPPKKPMIVTNATSPQKKRLDTQVRASPAILTMCVPAHYNWMKKNQNIPA
jgi:hypothetical protein